MEKTLDFIPEKIETLFPPVLIELTNKYFLIIKGFDWFEVSPDIKDKAYEIAKERHNKSKKIVVSNDKTYKVMGSSGEEYIVKLKNDNYSCTCVGYGFRRYCKHIDEVKTGKIKECTDPTTKDTAEYIKWTSDTGKTSYTITIRDKKYSCSCAGFKKNGKCKHVNSIF